MNRISSSISKVVLVSIALTVLNFLPGCSGEGGGGRASSTSESPSKNTKDLSWALLGPEEFPKEARVLSYGPVQDLDHDQNVKILQEYLATTASANQVCQSRLNGYLNATKRELHLASATTTADLLGNNGGYTLTVTGSPNLAVSRARLYTDTCAKQEIRSNDRMVNLLTSPIAAPDWLTKNRVSYQLYQQTSSYADASSTDVSARVLHAEVVIGGGSITLEARSDTSAGATGRGIEQFESVLLAFYLKAGAPVSPLRR